VKCFVHITKSLPESILHSAPAESASPTACVSAEHVAVILVNVLERTKPADLPAIPGIRIRTPLLKLSCIDSRPISTTPFTVLVPESVGEAPALATTYGSCSEPFQLDEPFMVILPGTCTITLPRLVLALTVIGLVMLTENDTLLYISETFKVTLVDVFDIVMLAEALEFVTTTCDWLVVTLVVVFRRYELLVLSTSRVDVAEVTLLSALSLQNTYQL